MTAQHPRHAVGPDRPLPRHAARGGRHSLPAHGRAHERQGRPSPAALRVLAPDAPLCLRRRRARSAPPALDGPAVHRLTRQDRVLVDHVGGGRWHGPRVPRRTPRAAAPAPPAPRDLGRRRGSRDLVGAPRRQAPRPTTGRGRAVPHLALPRPCRLAPGQPLLPVRCPRRTQSAHHRAGGRRRQRQQAPASAGQPCPRRRSVRPAQRPHPDPRPGGPDRLRSRQHAPPRSGRGAGLPPGEAILVERFTRQPVFAAEVDHLSRGRGLQVPRVPSLVTRCSSPPCGTASAPRKDAGSPSRSTAMPNASARWSRTCWTSRASSAGRTGGSRLGPGPDRSTARPRLDRRPGSGAAGRERGPCGRPCAEIRVHPTPCSVWRQGSRCPTKTA